MAATIIAGIGAAGALAGGAAGLMSAGGAAAASKENNRLAIMQFLEQRRQAQLAQDQAREGSTDARGNRTRYIPGQGWVTELTPDSRRMQSASDAEEFQRNTVDAASSRAVREMAARRQGVEAGVADTVLANRGVGSRSVDETQGALINSRAARAMAGNRAARRNVNMQALRQGSGGEMAIAELGRSGLEDTRTAIADSQLEAPGLTVGNAAAREGANNTSYNMFATRATNPVGVPFRPTSVGESGDFGQRALAQATQNATQLRAPQLGYAEDRTPTAIAGLGSATMGLGNWLREYQRTNAIKQPANPYAPPANTAPPSVNDGVF